MPYSFLPVALRRVYGANDEMTLTGAEFSAVLKEGDHAGCGFRRGVELAIHMYQSTKLGGIPTFAHYYGYWFSSIPTPIPMVPARTEVVTGESFAENLPVSKRCFLSCLVNV